MASESFRVGRSRLRGGDRLRAGDTPVSPGFEDLTAFALTTQGLRFTGGPKMNALARCAVTPTCFPAEDPIRPLRDLFDGDLGSMFRFAEPSDLSRIDADLSMIGGGNGVDATDADYWTVGVGSVLEAANTEIKTQGTLKLLSDPTAKGNVGFYQDIPCCAKEILKASANLYAPGGAGDEAQVTIQNIANGHYLTSAGTWSATPVILWSHNAGTVEENELVFRVQTLEECNGYPEPVLRFRCNKPTGSDPLEPVFFDNLGLWPAIGFFGAWWNNMDEIQAPTTINDYGSKTGQWSGEQVLLSSVTPKRGVTFFDYSEDPQAFRFHRITIDSGGYETEEPIEFAEMVIGYLQELSTTRPQGPLLGFQVEPRFPQARFSNAAGATKVYREIDHSIRKVSMEFFMKDEDELRALRDRMHGAVRGGAYPSILVHTDGGRMGTDFCVFGRFEDNLPTTWPGTGAPGKLYVRGSIVLNEEPGPLS